MNFKCRVCGCESFSRLWRGSSGGTCDNCSTVFNDPKKFSLHREVKIKYLDNYDLENWGELDYKHLYDSGFDLRAAISEPVTIYPYIDCKSNYNEESFIKIPFGIKIEFSDSDMDMKIYPRSGIGTKNGVVPRNLVGIIDNTYRGQVMGKFVNIDKEPFTINPGDRIVQAVIEKRLDVNIRTVTELSETQRGENGFNSTGKN